MNQLVHQSGDRLVVTSLEISNHFGKRHDNVMQSIHNLECSEKFRLLNFKASTYNNGQNRAQPMYEITRDGFTFLCMGFTGPQAAVWKERYIEAFNQMEAALRGNFPAQQQQLGLAREIGTLRDMIATQQTMILKLFERVDQARVFSCNGRRCGMTPSASSGQAPCPGVKGHGVQNVPGAWYDLAARLDAACAVLYWFNETLPVSLAGMQDYQQESINRAGSLAVAAENLLALCKRDIELLEQQLKSV